MSFKETVIGLIPSTWDIFDISEVSNVIDSLHQTPTYSDTGIPMVRVTDVKEDGLLLKNCYKVSEEVYKLFTKNHIPNLGDTVISRVGTYGVFSNVKTTEKFCLGQNTAIISPTKINSSYLFYNLINKKTKQQIDNFAVGSTQKTISLKNIKTIKIPVCEKVEQEAIADTLSCIDDKIELNNHINKTLEEMAQAIFKSWFVDFDPFQDGEFEDSELGRIPKGWRFGTINEYVVEMKNGGTPSRKKDNYWNSNDIPWIKTGEIKNSLILKSEEYISHEGLKNSSAKILPYNSVLMAMYGATAGQIGLLKFESCTNQACCAMICNSANKAIFLYLHLLNNQSYIESLAVGAAQQNLSKDTISKLKLIIPDDEVIESAQFNEIFNCIENNLRENQILTAIRDTILPKLMSGEIRVTTEEIQ